jgi:uncharacterized protein (DUF1499 family)
MRFPEWVSRLLGAVALVCIGIPSLHAASMLPPCPDRPNCVSSKATRPAQKVAPFAFSGPPEAAQMKLMRIIEQDRSATVVDARQGWIAAEFRSRFAGFIDDVRFEVDASASVFHVQSASRSGYWDLGVNRRRVEALRAKFDASR